MVGKGLTLRGIIKDAVETMCVTMWCICRVASTSIKKIIYVVCYYVHITNTAVLVLHSTTVATSLHVSSYLYRSVLFF